MARRGRFHGPDRRLALSPFGPARREDRGESVISTAKLLKSRWTPWALAAAAACLPLIANLVEFPYLVRVGGVVGLFMLLALGLNFTLGYVVLFDLGFIAFYAIGAYTTAIAMKAHVPAPLAMLLAVV